MCFDIQNETDIRVWLHCVDVLKQCSTVATRNRRTGDITTWRVLFVNITNVKILKTQLDFEFVGTCTFRSMEFPFIARGTLKGTKIQLTKTNYFAPSQTNSLCYKGEINHGKLFVSCRQAYGESNTLRPRLANV